MILTIQKALEFFNSGGIVINISALPQSSERIGSDDEILNKMVGALFDQSISDSSPYGEVHLSSKNGKAVRLQNPEAVAEFIRKSIKLDFEVVLHPKNEIFPRICEWAELSLHHVFAGSFPGAVIG